MHSSCTHIDVLLLLRVLFPMDLTSSCVSRAEGNVIIHGVCNMYALHCICKVTYMYARYTAQITQYDASILQAGIEDCIEYEKDASILR